MKKALATTLLLLATLGSMPALAQLSIIKPPSRVAVPISGAAITQPYRGMILWPLGVCSEKHDWTRDGADAKSCNNTYCSVEYYESAATRGTHVARDTATAWVSNGGGGCSKIIVSANRSYVVQYGPTAQLVSAPTHLAVDEGANFSFSSTVDHELAAGPVTYKLNFGDGTQFASSAGYYFYSAPGDYVVTFTVDDGYFKAVVHHTVHVYGDQPCGFGEELICQ